MSVPVPQVTPDPGTLPALRVLAVRDVRHVRCWLLAAPDVRHLIVYVPVGRMGLEVDAGFGDVIVSGHKQENPGMQRAETAALPVPRKNAVLQGHVIAAGRALEDVTIVAYAGEGDERQAEVVGSFRKEGYRRCRDSEGYVVSGPRVAKNMEGEVEIRRVWIPRPNVEAGEARPSLISPDILDVVDWA
ncbi:hypothetical protein BD626DRAFT_477805 [Schizophyllum amplum]|uniref:Uncharacterized protein n=1 Tax=Schizophyllum amplum TaxID=97359 RepID=A0A550D0G8_9AGAR|nr:hypothetical protein BD626DRAFT_477805 [Auriculariopsis ampla]